MNRGFTLLEVLVALTLTGLALALVALSISTGLRAHQRAGEHLDLIQTQREVTQRIYQNLSMAYLSPTVPSGAEEDWQSFDTDNANEPFDALTFSTLNYRTHRVNAKESDLALMTLFAKRDEDREPGEEDRFLLLQRVGGTINDRFEVEGGDVYTLADNVTHLSLDYLSADGELAHEWRVQDQGRKLPCAVVVKLGLRAENLQEISSCTVIPVVLSTLQPCRFEQGSLEFLCRE